MHINLDSELVGCIVGSISIIDGAGDATFIVGTIIDVDTEPTTEYQNYKFIQTEELTELGIAIHPYGAFIVPYTAIASDPVCTVKYGDDLYEAAFADMTEIGAQMVFTKVDDTGNV